MKPAHTFAAKAEEQLSLSWLDDNFKQALDRCDELEARLNAQGAIVAEQVTIILQLHEAIKKLQPKPITPVKVKK